MPERAGSYREFAAERAQITEICRIRARGATHAANRASWQRHATIYFQIGYGLKSLGDPSESCVVARYFSRSILRNSSVHASSLNVV